MSEWSLTYILRAIKLQKITTSRAQVSLQSLNTHRISLRRTDESRPWIFCFFSLSAALCRAPEIATRHQRTRAEATIGRVLRFCRSSFQNIKLFCVTRRSSIEKRISLVNLSSRDFAALTESLSSFSPVCLFVCFFHVHCIVRRDQDDSESRTT